MKTKFKIDRLGRFCIPQKLRDSYGLNPGDSLEIYINRGSICLRPFVPGNLGSRGRIGIVRRLDRLCRICIPPEYFETLELKKDSFYMVGFMKEDDSKVESIVLVPAP